MGKLKVYSEAVEVKIVRKGVEMTVPFSEIRDGDYVPKKHCTVDGDAHISDDADYEGYLFYDTSGESYFPEDFGAARRC